MNYRSQIDLAGKLKVSFSAELDNTSYKSKTEHCIYAMLLESRSCGERLEVVPLILGDF